MPRGSTSSCDRYCSARGVARLGHFLVFSHLFVMAQIARSAQPHSHGFPRLGAEALDGSLPCTYIVLCREVSSVRGCAVGSEG